jgi:6-phosphofructokinase 1
MTSNNNILIAQGGGPTNVINQSLVGIIVNEKKKKSNIFGSINGVNGIINNKFKSLEKISNEVLKFLKSTPGAALGSTRDKPDEKYCLEILNILRKKNMRKFYYIGGNDSSDSLKIISSFAKKKNYDLQCIHVPKTIDNDLVLNDHTPGFGSAAKYVAQLFSGINFDVKSLPGIYIGVVMGRHAGFLTASSSLLKTKDKDGPHLIFIPENTFELDKVLNHVKRTFDKYGQCILAVSEGIQGKNKKLLTEKLKTRNEYDAHGNIQLSGSGILGDYLAQTIKNKLNISRVRADTLGYPQRSFLGSTSEVDADEAYKIGLAAVKFAHTTPESFSIGIEERKILEKKYKIKFIINSLEEVAGKTKIMPEKFYDKEKCFVTKSFYNYCKPLIGKKIPETGSII